MIFFVTLAVRGPFYRKDFIWKKNWGTGSSSEKRKLCNEIAEAATNRYSATGDFLQYIYIVLKVFSS